MTQIHNLSVVEWSFADVCSELDWRCGVTCSDSTAFKLRCGVQSSCKSKLNTFMLKSTWNSFNNQSPQLLLLEECSPFLHSSISLVLELWKVTIHTSLTCMLVVPACFSLSEIKFQTLHSVTHIATLLMLKHKLKNNWLQSLAKTVLFFCSTAEASSGTDMVFWTVTGYDFLFININSWDPSVKSSIVMFPSSLKGSLLVDYV